MQFAHGKPKVPIRYNVSVFTDCISDLIKSHSYCGLEELDIRRLLEHLCESINAPGLSSRPGGLVLVTLIGALANESPCVLVYNYLVEGGVVTSDVVVE